MAPPASDWPPAQRRLARAARMMYEVFRYRPIVTVTQIECAPCPPCRPIVYRAYQRTSSRRPGCSGATLTATTDPRNKPHDRPQHYAVRISLFGASAARRKHLHHMAARARHCPSGTLRSDLHSLTTRAADWTGAAWSEPTLIRLAYAFEQATRYRRAPTFARTLNRTSAG